MIKKHTEKLDLKEIQKRIPHRDPFLFLDSVLEVSIPGDKRLAGRSIVAQAHIKEDNPIFRGHFPSYPIFPGVLVIDALAQAAGVIANYEMKFNGVFLLSKIYSATFTEKIRPNAVMNLSVELVRHKLNALRAKGHVVVKEKVAAKVELLFYLK